MKKALILVVLMLTILTGIAGCSMNKNKKPEIETGTEKGQDNPKASTVDMKDMDAIYEFFKEDMKDLSIEDFNLWEVNYLDITGDGTDEAVFAAFHGVEWPQKMRIISGDSGEYKLIPSDIPLYGYANNPELRDGFFVITGKTGGTGTESTFMDLYVYDGSEIISILKGVELFYRFSDAGASGVDVEVMGEIEGNLRDFIYTLTEFDNVAKKETLVKKEQYIYDEATMSFKSELIQSQGSSGQAENTVYASDIKVGDTINGGTVNKIIYTEGDEFGIGLKGEFTVTGEISYDDIFWADMILYVSEDWALPAETIIKFKFDDEYECIPPAGTFTINDTNLSLLESKIGSDMVAEIRKGKTLKVQAVIDNFSYYARYQTSPMWSCDLVDIVSYDVN